MKIFHAFYLLFTSASFLLLSSCSTDKIQLSSKEINFVKNRQNDFISLNYDKKAIREKRVDGIYKVVYSYYNTYYKNADLCRRDVNYATLQAYQIASAVKCVMAYKENHRFIDVIISSDEKGYRRNIEGENIACSYTIRFDVDSLKSTIISRYGN
jgi:hypothetical protein